MPAIEMNWRPSGSNLQQGI